MVTLTTAQLLHECTDSGFPSPSTAEDLNEGPSELNVEGGVDNRVEGTVDVTQPCKSAVKSRRHVACPAVGVQYVSHKERQPADEKDPWRSMERGQRQEHNRKI